MTCRHSSRRACILRIPQRGSYGLERQLVNIVKGLRWWHVLSWHILWYAHGLSEGLVVDLCSLGISLLTPTHTIHSKPHRDMSYPVYYPPSPPLGVPPVDALGAPSPVYVILIIGMFLFMATNAMPILLPDPAKIG